MKDYTRRFKRYSNAIVSYSITFEDAAEGSLTITESTPEEAIHRVHDIARRYSDAVFLGKPMDRYNRARQIGQSISHAFQSIVSVGITIVNHRAAARSERVRGGSDGLFSKLVDEKWIIISPQTRTLCAPFCVALATLYRDETVPLETIYQRTVSLGK